MSSFHDDSPIKSPEQDELGHGAFADSISKCIMEIKNPEGAVIAVHGSWGAGKSSMINLVLHKLNDQENRPIIIPFESWCYRSEDRLVAGFFREFYSKLKFELGDRKMNLKPLLKLGSYVSGVVDLATPSLDFMVGPGASSVASKIGAAAASGGRILQKVTAEPEGIDELKDDVSKVLDKLDRSVLVIIDDIDRLSPEEAVAIFRLIKSVGRLKKVTYLVAYDRLATESMIAEKYPSERCQYLEKIIQASFDLPELSESSIVNILNRRFEDIFGKTLTENSERNYDIVHEIVIPEIVTPRHVHRLANVLSITYPSVKDDVNVGDFIALETFRVFRPNLYRGIQQKKGALTKSKEYPSKRSHRSLNGSIEEVFLFNEPDEFKPRLRSAIEKIFPPVTNNFSHSRFNDMHLWNHEKRVCSELNFDTYFRFSVSKDAISEAEFREIISKASNKEFVIYKMREYICTEAAYGRTKASHFLDKINHTSEAIDPKDIGPFLCALYTIGQDITDIPDRVKEFGHLVDNRSRMLSLSNKMLINKSASVNVSSVMNFACTVLPIDFLVSLFFMIFENFYFPKKSPGHVNPGSVMKEEEIGKIREIVLKKIRHSVSDNSIVEFSNVPVFLYQWQRFTDNHREVEVFLKHMLKESHDSAVKNSQSIYCMFPGKARSVDLNSVAERWINDLIETEVFVSELFDVYRNLDVHDKERNCIMAIMGIISFDRDSQSPPSGRSVI